MWPLVLIIALMAGLAVWAANKEPQWVRECQAFNAAKWKDRVYDCTLRKPDVGTR